MSAHLSWRFEMFFRMCILSTVWCFPFLRFSSSLYELPSLMWSDSVAVWRWSTSVIASVGGLCWDPTMLRYTNSIIQLEFNVVLHGTCPKKGLVLSKKCVCVCVCVCVYIYIYIYIHTHTYIHTYILGVLRFIDMGRYDASMPCLKYQYLSYKKHLCFGTVHIFT